MVKFVIGILWRYYLRTDKPAMRIGTAWREIKKAEKENCTFPRITNFRISLTTLLIVRTQHFVNT